MLTLSHAAWFQQCGKEFNLRASEQKALKYENPAFTVLGSSNKLQQSGRELWRLVVPRTDFWLSNCDVLIIRSAYARLRIG
jgi:hypothetical protein